MAKEEKIIKLIENREKIKIEQSIFRNPIFLKLKKTLERFPDIKINMDEMIEAYMDLAQTPKLQDGKDIKIDDGLISKVISGIIYSISKEDNGVVIKSDGNLDINGTIESRMMAQYNYVSGLDELDEEQIKKLSDSIGEVVNIENKTIGIDSYKENTDGQFFWEGEKLSVDDLDFYSNLSSNQLTETGIRRRVEDTVENTNAEESIENREQNNFIYTREQLELVIIGASYEKMNPLSRRLAIAKLKTLPEAQKYINPQTGKVDIELALKAGQDWKRSYILQKREQVFSDYLQVRKQGITFDELSNKDKLSVLRAAFQSFEDRESSPEMKKAAIAVLVDISPDLVTSKEENEKYSFEISESALRSVYNSFSSGRDVTKVSDIRKRFSNYEESIAMGKLNFLDGLKEWKTKEEWEAIRREKKERTDISDVKNGLEEIHQLTSTKEDKISLQGLNALGKSVREGITHFVGQSVSLFGKFSSRIFGNISKTGETIQRLEAGKGENIQATEIQIEQPTAFEDKGLRSMETLTGLEPLGEDYVKATNEVSLAANRVESKPQKAKSAESYMR